MRADPRVRPITLEAETLLQESRRKEAIQALRDSDGVSHKEARRRIDAHIAQNPMLAVQLETVRRESRRRWFYLFLVVDVVIAAGVIYYFFYMPR